MCNMYATPDVTGIALESACALSCEGKSIVDMRS